MGGATRHFRSRPVWESRLARCPVPGPGRRAHRRDLLRGRPPSTSTSCRPSVEAGHVHQGDDDIPAWVQVASGHVAPVWEQLRERRLELGANGYRGSSPPRSTGGRDGGSTVAARPCTIASGSLSPFLDGAAGEDRLWHTLRRRPLGHPSTSRGVTPAGTGLPARSRASLDVLVRKGDGRLGGQQDVLHDDPHSLAGLAVARRRMVAELPDTQLSVRALQPCHVAIVVVTAGHGSSHHRTG